MLTDLDWITEMKQPQLTGKKDKEEQSAHSSLSLCFPLAQRLPEAEGASSTPAVY